MKKTKNDHILLLPGVGGWDLWSVQPSGSSLLAETGHDLALDIKKIPSNKPVVMAFPVRELTSLSLWTPNTDLEATSDLINLQIERMGLAQSEDLGVLNQHEPVGANESDKSLYRVDVLKAPAEGTLPSVSPAQFAISPLCYSFTPGSVTLWQEFNKWVLAVINVDGEVVHYQALTSASLELGVLQEINFTLAQLQLQQILRTEPNQYVVWTNDVSVMPAGYDSFESQVNKTVSLEEKPVPVFSQSGTLLPADTRADRLAAKQRKQQTFFAAMAALLLIGCVVFAGYKLIDLERRANVAAEQAENLTQQNQALLNHTDKWTELQVLTDSQNTPLNLLKESAGLIRNRDLRFRRATFEHQPTTEGVGTELSITIQGESPNSDLALEFDERLQKHKAFETLSWNNPAPTKSEAGWRFIYNAKQL